MPAEQSEQPGGSARTAREPRWRRYGYWALVVVVALVAGVVMSVFTVDLGPSLRERAEKAASDELQRPVRIGKLSAKLTPGVFVVEDLVIEGLEPDDRPFLTAKKITVELPWWSAYTREITVRSVEMTDWHLVFEQFAGTPERPNGWTNFPKRKPRPPRQGPKRWTTTIKAVVASRGRFEYYDHGVPWTTTGKNLRVAVYRAADDYRGTASFSDGTVKIQNYEQFSSSMTSRFNIKDGTMHFDRIDLVTDGAHSVMDADLDIARWPEQIYRIRSDIDFAVQKDIFFQGQPFDVEGRGEFRGYFHLFKGGRDLKGSFSSPLTTVTIGKNDWTFPNLRGDVQWVPQFMHVTNASSGLYGGTATFDYRLAPLNQKGVPTRAVWDVAYQNVDLKRLTDFLRTEGIRLDGRIAGRNRLEWALGKWADKAGEGYVRATPPAGVVPMTRELSPERVAHEAELPQEHGPFNPHSPLGYVPIAGEVRYRLDPDWITLDGSWVATPKTFVSFQGRTAYGEDSNIPFHVTSLDWQESDRVLAGIMTAFGAPTGAVPIGGHGEFDGVMLKSFTKPRIEGTFSGDRMRAWDVLWGRGQANVVIEDSYAHVSESVITSGDSEIVASGRFSLGYPRRDGGEELNARVRLNKRPLADLRHAFELDDWPVEGLVSGEYHVWGNYETPHGFGKLVIEDGVAYGETFELATAGLRFEGAGVRVDSIDVRKNTGSITGAAWIGWDGTYSFNVDGSRIPVESLAVAKFELAPLSGLLQFNAQGTGTFEEPRYDVKLRVDDLYASDEGIGQLTGRLGLRGEMLTLELEAASPRLRASGSGRIAMTPEMDAELTFRFGDTSLDPYLRFFEPRLSPFTRAVADGTVRIVGELAAPEHLIVETKVEQLDLTLFDYRLRNKETIDLRLNQEVVEIASLHLVGEGTELQVQGDISLRDSTLAVEASGDANLGILQGFFRDLRSSGQATLNASVTGPLDAPTYSGKAQITDGRIRHFSLPHSLEAINGQLSFDADGIRVDNVVARLAQGDVVFGGRIGMTGFVPGELSLTASGENMRLRYPEGFNSTVDADLLLRGPVSAPELSGKVTVRNAIWTKRFETDPDIFNFGGGSRAVALPTTGTAQTVPLRFDIEIVADNSLRVRNNLANIVASADLRLQGTYDRPILYGRAEVESGYLTFEGNRYLITRGTVDFTNPQRIEPYYDLEAETRVRAPGQTYRVTINMSGTTGGQPSLTFNSDPPLSNVDIFSLLLGQTAGLENAELRALTSPNQSEEQLLRTATARLLGGALSAPVGRVVERSLGIDTVQITPSFSQEGDALSSARLLIGTRLSSRAYVTFVRALGIASAEQVIILEYDQNDRLGWVLTQTGDRTFAVDFRVRHRF